MTRTGDDEALMKFSVWEAFTWQVGIVSKAFIRPFDIIIPVVDDIAITREEYLIQRVLH